MQWWCVRVIIMRVVSQISRVFGSGRHAGPIEYGIRKGIGSLTDSKTRCVRTLKTISPCINIHARPTRFSSSFSSSLFFVNMPIQANFVPLMQKVLLVGAGVSSTDIARELGGVADYVYQSSRNGDFDLPSTLLPPNGTRIGEIASFDIDIPQQNGNNNENVGYDTLHTAQQPIPSTITLASGHKLCGVHSVLVCTGYHISYPFLRHYHNDNISATAANDTVIVTDGTQVHNLHKDIFYIPDPTLSFIGAPYYTATFTLFEFQAIALAAVLSGRAVLPSKVEMRREYCAKLKRKGAGRHFNSLKDEEVDYVRDLVAWVNRDADRFGGHIVQGHTEEWHVAKKEQLERLRQIFGEKDKDRDKERNGELLLNGSAALLLAPCT
jgi:ACS family pantothenate transporter-like MFS transporter